CVALLALPSVPTRRSSDLSQRSRFPRPSAGSASSSGGEVQAWPSWCSFFLQGARACTRDGLESDESVLIGAVGLEAPHLMDQKGGSSYPPWLPPPAHGSASAPCGTPYPPWPPNPPCWPPPKP